MMLLMESMQPNLKTVMEDAFHCVRDGKQQEVWTGGMSVWT